MPQMGSFVLICVPVWIQMLVHLSWQWMLYLSRMSRWGSFSGGNSFSETLNCLFSHQFFNDKESAPLHLPCLITEKEN